MKILIIVLVTILLTSCKDSKQTFTYEKIDSIRAQEIINESASYLIIDVRTVEEYESGHLNNAINIPVDEINSTLDISKDTILFVYCRSGARSKIAAEALIDLGYTVYDLGAYENISLEE